MTILTKETQCQQAQGERLSVRAGKLFSRTLTIYTRVYYKARVLELNFVLQCRLRKCTKI